MLTILGLDEDVAICDSVERVDDSSEADFKKDWDGALPAR